MPGLAIFGSSVLRRNMLGNATRRRIAIGQGLITNIKSGFISFKGIITKSASTVFGLNISRNL